MDLCQNRTGRASLVWTYTIKPINRRNEHPLWQKYDALVEALGPGVHVDVKPSQTVTDQ